MTSSSPPSVLEHAQASWLLPRERKREGSDFAAPGPGKEIEDNRRRRAMLREETPLPLIAVGGAPQVALALCFRQLRTQGIEAFSNSRVDKGRAEAHVGENPAA